MNFRCRDLNNYLSTEKMEIRFGLLILKVVKKMDYAKTLLMLTWLILSFLALAITTEIWAHGCTNLSKCDNCYSRVAYIYVLCACLSFLILKNIEQ